MRTMRRVGENRGPLLDCVDPCRGNMPSWQHTGCAGKGEKIPLPDCTLGWSDMGKRGIYCTDYYDFGAGYAKIAAYGRGCQRMSGQELMGMKEGIYAAGGVSGENAADAGERI